MQHLFYILVLTLILGLSPAYSEDISQKNAITYNECGRLGNNLITYLGAKWLAVKYDLPLLYLPFPYSDQFLFHDQEPYLYSSFEQLYLNTTIIKQEADIPLAAPQTLIEVNFLKSKKDKISFQPYRKDPQFLHFVRKILKPKFPVKTLQLPKGKLTVLVHVRTGGGFDSKKEKLRLFNKFPPHIFYHKSLEMLSEMYEHKPIYAHIMTDDPNPQQILDDYKSALSHLPNIEWGIRSGESGPETNVLDDFFSVPKFDCIIRGSSTFTVAASLLQDFKAIFTAQCHVENDEIVFDSVHVEKHRKK